VIDRADAGSFYNNSSTLPHNVAKLSDNTLTQATIVMVELKCAHTGTDKWCEGVFEDGVEAEAELRALLTSVM